MNSQCKVILSQGYSSQHHHRTTPVHVWYTVWQCSVLTLGQTGSGQGSGWHSACSGGCQMVPLVHPSQTLCHRNVIKTSWGAGWLGVGVSFCLGGVVVVNCPISSDRVNRWWGYYVAGKTTTPRLCLRARQVGGMDSSWVCMGVWDGVSVCVCLFVRICVCVCVVQVCECRICVAKMVHFGKRFFPNLANTQ